MFASAVLFPRTFGKVQHTGETLPYLTLLTLIY